MFVEKEGTAKYDEDPDDLFGLNEDIIVCSAAVVEVGEKIGNGAISVWNIGIEVAFK